MRAGVSVTCKGEGLFTLVKMQVTLLTLVLVATQVSALSDLSDIPGHYCSTRRIPCCTARQDECSLPIMGTVCYCDQFCDREVNDDCCPDYAPVCLNRTRTTTQRPTFRPTPNPQLRGCEYKGRSYERGQGVKINCNQCKCDLKCRSRTDCVLEFSCEQNPCLMDPKLIASINSDNLGWRATNYSQFWGRTLDEGLSRRLGTRHSKRRAYSMRPINSVFDRDRVRARLFYDLRSERPDMISPPLDQGWCAADWVISTVQVATDRLMLMSKGEDRAVLSPQHLLSCNSKSQRGCDGGHLTRAWKFIQKFGLVPEACYPWVGRQTNCSISKQRDKRRTMARCSSGNNLMPLHRTGPAYRVSKEPESIMNEILISGPVQATMKVTDDFFTYQSGVYRCAGGRYSRTHRNETYHAVRIIGWGEEIQQGRPVKYWIVSNSWGTWWGEKGFFRITRGVNECEIESLVLASWINAITPKRDPLMPTMDRANMLSNRLF